MDSNNKKKKTEITDLHKDLVPQILSWLPTKAAVAVSYLFLRGSWQIDLRYLSSLEFYFDYDQEEDSFVSFVSDVLRRRGDNCKVDSFSLEIYDEIDGTVVSPWIEYALDNRVKNLKIRILDIRDFYLTPRVFVQESLVTLKLATHLGLISIFGDDVAVVALPLLKTLWLDDILIEDNETFVRLISSCPVLEELVMIDMKWQMWEYCLVASATLKRLKIIWSKDVEMDEFDRCPQSVSFDTPNLLYLEYADHITKKYPVLNFVSLIEARIRVEEIDENEEESEEEDGEEEGEEEGIVGITAFILGIIRVRKIYLSQNTILVLNNCTDPIPKFVNWTHLTIQSYKTIGWESIPKLLSSCPHLETLVLEGLFHLATGRCGDACPCMDKDEKNSCLVTSPVTLLEIYEVISEKDRGEVIEDEARFVKQVRYFLMRMPHLQQVKIYGQTANSVTALYEIATELRRLEGKASPKVQISVLRA